MDFGSAASVPLVSAGSATRSRGPARVRGARRAEWSDWPEGALVALAGLACLLVLDALVLDQPSPRGDEQIYELRARDPLGTHTFPFAYGWGCRRESAHDATVSVISRSRHHNRKPRPRQIGGRGARPFEVGRSYFGFFPSRTRSFARM